MRRPVLVLVAAVAAVAPSLSARAQLPYHRPLGVYCLPGPGSTCFAARVGRDYEYLTFDLRNLSGSDPRASATYEITDINFFGRRGPNTAATTFWYDGFDPSNYELNVGAVGGYRETPDGYELAAADEAPIPWFSGAAYTGTESFNVGAQGIVFTTEPAGDFWRRGLVGCDAPTSITGYDLGNVPVGVTCDALGFTGFQRFNVVPLRIHAYGWYSPYGGTEAGYDATQPVSFGDYAVTVTTTAGACTFYGVNFHGRHPDACVRAAFLATPEPALLTLFGTGVVGLGLADWARRRRTRRGQHSPAS